MISLDKELESEAQDTTAEPAEGNTSTSRHRIRGRGSPTSPTADHHATATADNDVRVDVPLTAVTSMEGSAQEQAQSATQTRVSLKNQHKPMTESGLGGQALRAPVNPDTQHRPLGGGGSGMSPRDLPPFAKRTRNCFNAMPVVFVVLLIAVLYSIFIGYHCIPNLQLDVEPELRNNSKRLWAMADLVIFNFLFIMLVMNYVFAIVTPAGSIPNDHMWTYEGEMTEINLYSLPPAAEVKRTGERRSCRWCCKVKPDRTHHCRVCRRCVLKMDHHCPWIYNCVGWGNHKYFFLLDFYSAVTSIYESIRLVGSVVESIKQPLTPFGKMFLLLFGETLSCFIAIITLGFFFFHVMLALRAETTIEYCERRFAGHHPIGLYNKSLYQNITEVLGPNPLLWLIPIDNRVGNGIEFLTEASRLMIDLESKNSRLLRTSSNPKSRKEKEGRTSAAGSTVLGSDTMGSESGSSSWPNRPGTVGSAQSNPQIPQTQKRS